MYSITTTSGFIISSRPFAEAGKILSVFTRDLGLVTVVAQGIRFEKSKLRYHVKDYAFGIFSLVKGKEFWRLTNAQALEYSQPNDNFKQEILLNIRMANLLRRLLHGEEPHPELFDCLYSTFKYISNLSKEKLPELESLTALRILNLLGYVGDSEIVRPFVISNNLSEEILASMSVSRLKINGIINSSLQASHL